MRRKTSLGIALACIAIAVLAARPAPTPGPIARDFEAYWAAGATWSTHADPYGRAIWNAQRMVPGVNARRDELLPFVGPPATLPLFGALARLPYRAAATLWLFALALSTLALVAVVVLASARAPRTFNFLAACALALAFGPITSDLALGQLALPAFLGAALVTLCAVRPVSGAAAACLALAQPNASLGLVSQLGRNRATLALAASAVAMYALGTLALGPAWPIAYARTLAAHASAERLSAIQLTPAAIAHGFGAAPVVADIAGIACAILAVAAALAIALRATRSFPRFAAFSALVPFAAGFVHEHDLVVAYAGAAWCGLRTRGTARTIALAGTLLAAVDWLGLAQRPTGVAQSALLGLAVFAAFGALGETMQTRDWAVLLPAFGALFVTAAWIAAHNPAPVWPDALGAFHRAPGATIAALWAGEQRRSGLFAAVPAWAALRSLSLLGCALLACAIYRHSTSDRTA